MLKAHHKLMLRRMGFSRITVTSVGRLCYHDADDLLRKVEMLATDINYGRLGVKVGAFVLQGKMHHRVRIMEPGSSRVHFIDCEVPV